MTHVLHLLACLRRQHRPWLLGWIAVVVMHPILALTRWSPDLGAGAFTLVGLLSIARVVLSVLIVGMVVQANGASDERAFWRTRPIGPAALGTATVALTAGVFVLVPLLVTLAVAAWVGVPPAHWLSSIAQVAAVEGGLMAFALLVASRTRNIATFLVATLALMAAFSLVQGALLELRRGFAPSDVLRPAHPLQGLIAMGTVWAVTGPLLYGLALRGRRTRRAFAVGSLVLTLASLAVWFLPTFRVNEPTPLSITMTLPADAITAQVASGQGGPVTLVAQPRVGGTQPGDVLRIVARAGALITPHGRVRLDPSATSAGARSATRASEPVIAVLSEAQHASLVGTRVRFEGTMTVDVTRRVTEASAPLAAGATLDAPHLRLRVNTVLDSRDPTLERLRPSAIGMELHLTTPFAPVRHGHSYALTDPATGCTVTTIAANDGDSAAMALALLPTIWKPFSARRIVLGHLVDAPCRVDPARAIVAMRTIVTPPPTTIPVSVAFVVPPSRERGAS